MKMISPQKVFALRIDAFRTWNPRHRSEGTQRRKFCNPIPYFGSGISMIDRDSSAQRR